MVCFVNNVRKGNMLSNTSNVEICSVFCIQLVVHRLYIYRLNKICHLARFLQSHTGFYSAFDRFSEHYCYSISSKYNVNIQPSILLILLFITSNF